MIYVEEKEFNRQIALLDFLAKPNTQRICAWLYPESSVHELAGFNVAANSAELEPVTSYENGINPKHTELVEASPEHIGAFGSALNSLRDNCDSLALYSANSTKWSVATIGHEGMCLVRNQELLSSLVSAGFNASTEPPSWW